LPFSLRFAFYLLPFAFYFLIPKDPIDRLSIPRYAAQSFICEITRQIHNKSPAKLCCQVYSDFAVFFPSTCVAAEEVARNPDDRGAARRASGTLYFTFSLSSLENSLASLSMKRS